MPMEGGGFLSSLWISLDGVKPASPWLLGGIAIGQATAIVWLLTRNLAAGYRAAIAVAAFAIVAAATMVFGLSARTVGPALGGICHAAAYVCLLTWFASSLQPGREPVVTGVARQMRSSMPETVVRYTRHVTIAWCVFFAAQLVTSAALLTMAPVAVWSPFVNVLNFPLVLGMILAEFGVRLFRFRREQRTGLFATLAAMRHVRPASLGSRR